MNVRISSRLVRRRMDTERFQIENNRILWATFRPRNRFIRVGASPFQSETSRPAQRPPPSSHARGGFVKRIIEFGNVKTAFVYIKMNVALLKIGRAGFPCQRFRVKHFDRAPCGIADAFSVYARVDEEQIETIAVGFMIDHQHQSADLRSIQPYAIGLAVHLRQRFFNGTAGNDFALCVRMVIASAEFLHRAVFERPLVV